MSAHIFPWYIRLWRKLTPWIKRKPVIGHGRFGTCGIQIPIYKDEKPDRNSMLCPKCYSFEIYKNGFWVCENCGFKVDFQHFKKESEMKGKNKGACGGKPRRDGSGGGKGNRGTGKQPKKGK